MYVRMYVGVYVCIYLCMYVCMYLCMYICIYVCMHYVCVYVCVYANYVCMYLCMYVCMYVFRYVCMCVRMYVCVYVRMYECMYLHSAGICHAARHCISEYHAKRHIATYVCCILNRLLFRSVVVPVSTRGNNKKCVSKLQALESRRDSPCRRINTCSCQDARM